MANDYILLFSRIILGLYFLFNSFNHFRNLNSLTSWVQSKNVPAPKLMVALTGILLLIGGLSILLGAYIEIGILALTLFFLPVTFVMHDFWRETDPQMKMMQMINFMKNLALWAAILALLFVPKPWPLSFSLF
jgi:putative oxidoreductase